MKKIEPEELGFKRVPLTGIRGGDAEKNTEILYSVLKNQPSAYLDTVLLNAGLGFFSNGKTETIEAGIQLADQCIKDGAAHDKLEQFIRVQKGVA